MSKYLILSRGGSTRESSVAFSVRDRCMISFLFIPKILLANYLMLVRPAAKFLDSPSLRFCSSFRTRWSFLVSGFFPENLHVVLLWAWKKKRESNLLPLLRNRSRPLFAVAWQLMPRRLKLWPPCYPTESVENRKLICKTQTVEKLVFFFRVVSPFFSCSSVACVRLDAVSSRPLTATEKPVSANQ